MKSKLLPVFVMIAFILFILAAPDRTGLPRYPSIVLSVPTIFSASTGSELLQDIYGFRALVGGLNPYAPLSSAVTILGAEWRDQLPTTHVPTAFLLVAPVAFLPLHLAYIVWAWLMLGALIVTLRVYDFSWETSIVLGLLATVFWPPVILSFGNFPCIWMLGLSLAHHHRNRNPLLAGVWIAIASFTKLLPAVMLIPFILKRKWAAVAGFILAWAVALGLLSILSPSILTLYLEANKIATPAWIGYIGNGSLLVFLLRHYGLPGFGVGVYLLLVIFILNWHVWLNQSSSISTEAWRLFSFFSVMLLPIAWTYSIAPILPDLLILARSPTPKRILGVMALAGPIIAVILDWPAAGVILLLLIPYGLSWLLIHKFEVHVTS